MTDLWTMGLGSTMGFVFRFMAESRKSRNDQFKQMLQGRKAAVESADAAAKRDGGKIIRRFLVVSVVVRFHFRGAYGNKPRVPMGFDRG